MSEGMTTRQASHCFTCAHCHSKVFYDSHSEAPLGLAVYDGHYLCGGCSELSPLELFFSFNKYVDTHCRTCANSVWQAHETDEDDESGHYECQLSEKSCSPSENLWPQWIPQVARLRQIRRCHGCGYNENPADKRWWNSKVGDSFASECDACYEKAHLHRQPIKKKPTGLNHNRLCDLCPCTGSPEEWFQFCGLCTQDDRRVINLSYSELKALANYLNRRGMGSAATTPEEKTDG